LVTVNVPSRCTETLIAFPSHFSAGLAMSVTRVYLVKHRLGPLVKKRVTEIERTLAL
jgi:hypothetical protein